MASQKVTLTIPQSLHREAKRLIKAGYYANLAELARAGIWKEITESPSVDAHEPTLIHVHLHHLSSDGKDHPLTDIDHPVGGAFQVVSRP